MGCGYGDLGGVLYRLGSDVTAIDARQEHLKIVNKKYSGIRTIQANLDTNWPFHGQKFDIILDLGLLCHLSNYEKHLNAVCASTTHLILETAVCDSDDPHKVIVVDEDSKSYDLAYGGKGCRPSPAAIERVLRESGMNFKRLDNAKYNSGEYSYDWYPKNDNSININKRRIWFIIKENSPIQFANPTSEIAHPPIIIATSPQGYISPIINKNTLSNSLMAARIEAEARAKIAANAPLLSSMPIPSSIRTHTKELSLNNRVRADSRDFSLITPDDYQSSTHPDIKGIILPNTHSSKMWYKKISPLFPNFKLSNKALSMQGFAKSDAIPDLVMCSLDNLQSHVKVWIDEWASPALTQEHLDIIKKCHAIITPSLINAQEIWKHLPQTNIFRISKPWPAIDVPAAGGDYFLYFEKSAELTDILLKAWDIQWGNLAIVGASSKLPTFATYVSDTESYTQIMKLMLGSKGLIDLSENNYYASGIVTLARSLNLPVLSNNCEKLDIDVNFIPIQQDKKISLNPTIDNIKLAMSNFNSTLHSKPNSFGINTYNNFLVNEVRKMVGG